MSRLVHFRIPFALLLSQGRKTSQQIASKRRTIFFSFLHEKIRRRWRYCFLRKWEFSCLEKRAPKTFSSSFPALLRTSSARPTDFSQILVSRKETFSAWSFVNIMLSREFAFSLHLNSNFWSNLNHKANLFTSYQSCRKPLPWIKQSPLLNKSTTMFHGLYSYRP